MIDYNNNEKKKKNEIKKVNQSLWTWNSSELYSYYQRLNRFHVYIHLTNSKFLLVVVVVYVDFLIHIDQDMLAEMYVANLEKKIYYSFSILLFLLMKYDSIKLLY